MRREPGSIPELRDRERLRGRTTRSARDLSDEEIERLWVAIWTDDGHLSARPVRPVRPVPWAAYVVVGVLVTSSAMTLLGFAVVISWLVRAAAL